MVRRVLEPYSRYLIFRGYSAQTCHVYVRAVEYFGRWLGRRRISWFAVHRFVDQGLPTCRCRGLKRDRQTDRAALHRLLEMLGQDRQKATFPQGWLGKLLRRYQAQLVNVRGLAPGTMWRYLGYTRAMINRLGVRRPSQFMRWTPQLIEQYVSGEGRFSPSRGRNVGGCARSFLRFLLQDGLIRRDLAAAVPTFARWRLASLPTTLRQEEINRLIRAADRRTPLGRRNYAMILCMSELGLRASDVSKLEIEAIDFAAGVLRLHQRKEREAAVLPMTRRLCSALKTYLRRDRPPCNSPAVFIRHRPQ